MADAMKLVPVEPTEAMRRAAFDAFEVDDPKQYANGTAARDAVWSAMLAAAPPAVEGGVATAKGGQWDAHTGEDYAVVMLPSETTDTASIHIYSDDADLPQRIADALNTLATREEAPASSEAVATAGTMPGTVGFTMACFKADDVPVGTPLYLVPPSPDADKLKVAVEALEAIKAQTGGWGISVRCNIEATVDKALAALSEGK